MAQAALKKGCTHTSGRKPVTPGIAALRANQREIERIIISSNWPIRDGNSRCRRGAEQALLTLPRQRARPDRRNRACSLKPAENDSTVYRYQGFEIRGSKRGKIEDELGRAVFKHRAKLVKRYVKQRHKVGFKYFRTHKSEFDKGQWTLPCCHEQSDHLYREETVYHVFAETKFARKAKVPGVGKLRAYSVL
jgi:hypothetical protein